MAIPGVSDNAIYIEVDNPHYAKETDYVASFNLPEQYKIEDLKIILS